MKRTFNKHLLYISTNGICLLSLLVIVQNCSKPKSIQITTIQYQAISHKYVWNILIKQLFSFPQQGHRWRRLLFTGCGDIPPSLMGIHPPHQTPTQPTTQPLTHSFITSQPATHPHSWQLWMAIKQVPFHVLFSLSKFRLRKRQILH